MRGVKLFLAAVVIVLLISSGHFITDNNYLQNANKPADENIERVLIHLENIPQGSKEYPGSDGMIFLERRGYKKESETLDGMAVFSNVPQNSGYKITGIHQSNSQAFNRPVELWGVWTNVTISEKFNEFTYTRNMPYILDIKASYNRQNSANPSLSKGDTIRFNIMVSNPSFENYKGRVRLLLKNANTGKIFTINKDIYLTARGERQSLILTFKAEEAGEYYLAPGVFIKHRINQWTDCWDWSSDPAFFVSEEHRTLHFAGFSWDVKAGFGNPGSNFWSNDTSDVWVDQQGRLHLTLAKKSNDRWYSTEVISRETFNYGTYTFFLDANPAAYDPHVVAGIFLYRDEQNEIDIEFSRWGNDQNYHIGNYVIQPAETPGNQFSFPLFTNGSHTTHQIIWKPGEIFFSSWHGHYQSPPNNNYISQWHYKGDYTPEPNGLRLFFNLWLFRGISPKTNTTEKLIINDFFYNPV
ncbi:MAG: glycoside hydrolase family 16 protein [Bacteroidales bacterium]